MTYLTSTTSTGSKLIYSVPAITTTDDTNENTVFTVSVPANSITSTGGMTVQIPFTTSSPVSGSTRTHTIRLKFGGSTILSGDITYPAFGGGSGIGGNGILIATLFNTSSSAQNLGLSTEISPGGVQGSSITGAYGFGTSSTSAVDTTATQTLAITIQKSTAGQTTTFLPGSVIASN